MANKTGNETGSHASSHSPAPADAADLRRIAEERLAGQRTEGEAAARLVHELQVHQIELEMQNEELKQARATADARLAQYIDLYDFAPTGYLTLDREGAIRQVNLTGAQLLGIERSRLVNRRFGQFVAEGDRHTFSNFLKKVFASEAKECCEVAFLREGLQHLVARIEGTRSADEQECRAVVLDITERKRAEEALREKHQRLDFILQATRTHIDIVDSEYNLRHVDEDWQKIYGDPRGRKCHEYFMGLNKPCPGCGIPKALAIKNTVVSEELLPKENRPIEVHSIPFQGKNGEWLVAELNIDITDRKQAAAEHEKLQAQFAQAQKMESVGRLAGGVAHDFNNLLMGIMGYTDLCRDKIAPDHPIREYLDEIARAADRSAEITRQLLAFARKQTIAPRVLDLNDAVAGMLKLLRRLIGEDIKLTWRPGADVRPVKLDPSQVDQILANLCVNARDAIAGVGEIALETGNIAVDTDYCATHPEAIPGAYVFLAVSDNGCGMDKETLAQVFEPFFTTKSVGKGTGLGLAAVYGIVKQNNGFIYAYSEPGKGTTFKIYLPEIAAETVATTVVGKTDAPRGQGETILLVEDEKSLRVTCGLFLEALDYKVLVAETPGEATRDDLARKVREMLDEPHAPVEN